MTPDSGDKVLTVGVVSDTHGALDPALLAALAGVDRIIHAGDIGGAAIMVALAAVAPVLAVRGNTDHDPALASLPAFAIADIGGVRFVVTHRRDVAYRVDDARRAGFDVYVFGHTHVPHLEESAGLWIINPGSASDARGDSAESLAIVEVRAGEVLDAKLVVI